MDYTQHSLATGRVVEMRPLGWDEYWQIQKDNVLAMQEAEKKAESMNPLEYTLVFFDTQRAAREHLLAPCVKDWESMRGELLMPEVVEIEETLKKISRIPVQLGNFAPAAEAAAAAGQTTAASA